ATNNSSMFTSRTSTHILDDLLTDLGVHGGQLGLTEHRFSRFWAKRVCKSLSKAKPGVMELTALKANPAHKGRGADRGHKGHLVNRESLDSPALTLCHRRRP